MQGLSVSAMQIMHVLKGVKEAFSKGNCIKEWHFDDILKQNGTTRASNSRYITSMEMQDLNTNLVCHIAE